MTNNTLLTYDDTFNIPKRLKWNGGIQFDPTAILNCITYLPEDVEVV